MKNLAMRFALVTAICSSCGLVGLAPAKASTVTWNFVDPGTNPGPGNLGVTSANFLDTAGSYALTAYGITQATYLPDTAPPNSAPTVGSRSFDKR